MENDKNIKSMNTNLNPRFHCSNPKNKLTNKNNATWHKKPKRNTLIPLNCLILTIPFTLFDNNYIKTTHTSPFFPNKIIFGELFFSSPNINHE